MARPLAGGPASAERIGACSHPVLPVKVGAVPRRAGPAYRSKEVRIISRVGFCAPRTYTLMSILLNPGTECG